MKSRPILFSGTMVRAILNGTKTQTRRIVKRTDSGRVKATQSSMNWHLDDPNAINACPYGKPVDQLWVRETWQSIRPWHHGYELCAPDDPAVEIRYRATDETFVPPLPWRPSIFMPRAASRITLEVTGIRVERLQDITEADAKAEGWDGKEECRPIRPLNWYRLLWEHINGPGSWDANPFVWVIEFNRIKPE